jgi:hypothetical protein
MGGNQLPVSASRSQCYKTLFVRDVRIKLECLLDLALKLFQGQTKYHVTKISKLWAKKVL